LGAVHVAPIAWWSGLRLSAEIQLGSLRVQ
jgi:hypothetical protein